MTARIKSRKLKSVRPHWQKPRLAKVAMWETALADAGALDSPYFVS